MAVLTLDNAIDESRKKAAEDAARSPNLFPTRDGNPRYYHHLEYACLSSLFFFEFCLVTLIVFSPPRCPCAGILLSVAPCVKQLSVPLEHVPGTLFFLFINM